MHDTASSHKDLIVWQKAVHLCREIYDLTGTFPPREIYGLASQMRRASVSIASNIAEGRSRGTTKDFVYFLHIAYGSAAELETQLIIGKSLDFCSEKRFTEVDSLLTEVSKMLHAMIKKLGG